MGTHEPLTSQALRTGTADQLKDKTLQSNGVKSTHIFSMWSPTQSSNMELKGMFTLMERNYETNLETDWKKTQTKAAQQNWSCVCKHELNQLQLMICLKLTLLSYTSVTFSSLGRGGVLLLSHFPAVAIALP